MFGPEDSRCKCCCSPLPIGGDRAVGNVSDHLMQRV
jgi:hypothetical protein